MMLSGNILIKLNVLKKSIGKFLIFLLVFNLIENAIPNRNVEAATIVTEDFSTSITSGSSFTRAIGGVNFKFEFTTGNAKFNHDTTGYGVGGSDAINLHSDVTNFDGTTANEVATISRVDGGSFKLHSMYVDNQGADPSPTVKIETKHNGSTMDNFTLSTESKTLSFNSLNDVDSVVLTSDCFYYFLIDDFKVEVSSNQAPTNIQLTNNTISENANSSDDSNSMIVGTLSATDEDSSSFTYNIVNPPTDFPFEIAGTNGDVLKLKDSATLNYEVKSSYTFTVRVTDDSNNTHDEEFTVNVSDVTSGELSSLTIYDNVGQEITSDLNTPYAHNTDAYTLNVANEVTSISIVPVESDKTDFIDIQDATGTTVLMPTLSEGENKFYVKVFDQKESGNLLRTITLTVNRALSNATPSNIALSSASISENATSGTIVGTITADGITDDGDQVTYSVADNTLFELTNINQIAIKSGANLDYETATSHQINVTVNDGVNDAVSETITINVTNEENTKLLGITLTGSDATNYANQLKTVNDADTTFSKDVTEYNVTVLHTVTTLTASGTPIDTDEIVEVSVGNTVDEDGTITLNEGQNIIKVKTYYTDNQGGEVISVYTFNVTKEAPPNQAPTVSTTIDDLNVGTYSPNDTIHLANHFTDADENDTLVYTVSNNNGSSIVNATITGSILTLDYQSAGTANITVKADDQKGGTVDTTFTVTVKVEVLGDGNGDGLITPADSLFIFQSLKTNGVGLTDKQKLLLDVNQDNQITSEDARYIMQMYVGLIDAFPTVEN